ncbi:MAG: ABC transporter ATP-binding protein [Bacteroidaceae bacterium]|nr:ABC transporter ATP-binding protein [Bacteroidaceae bacterium]
MHKTIQLKDLTIGYSEKGARKKIIAQGICAMLYGGQLTCLLGKNGAGKSTLLRTLSAFIPPLGGDVLIEGKPLMGYTSTERARLIGVVLTERPELQHMTVHELAGMGRSPYTGFWGRLSREDNTLVGEALRMVGMDTMATRMVDTLSDGERQKVMIAKALSQQTPVIFLDEPTAFLDYPSKVDTMLLLRRLAHETGKIIFLSTHDVELAMQTADTLWLMRRVRGEEGRGDEVQGSRLKVQGSRLKAQGSSDEGVQEEADASRRGEPMCSPENAEQIILGQTHRSAPTLDEKKLVNPSTDSSTIAPLTIGSPRELTDNGALENFFAGEAFTFEKDEMRFRIKF